MGGHRFPHPPRTSTLPTSQQCHNSTTSVHPPSTAVSLTAFPGCITDCTGQLCNSLLYKIFPNEESQHPYFSYRLHGAPLQLPHTQSLPNCQIAAPLVAPPPAVPRLHIRLYPRLHGNVSETPYPQSLPLIQNRSTLTFPTGCTGRLRNGLMHRWF